MTQEYVITWQAPTQAGHSSCINVSIRQEKMLEKAGVWIKNGSGQEYCQVKIGKHLGYPTFTDEEIQQYIDR